MAKYKVEQFEHTIKDNGNGFDNLYLSLTLRNSGGNTAIRKYRIVADTNWPDLADLTELITGGLARAQLTKATIELSEYPERTYLTLELPNGTGKDHIRVTAAKL